MLPGLAVVLAEADLLPGAGECDLGAGDARERGAGVFADPEVEDRAGVVGAHPEADVVVPGRCGGDPVGGVVEQAVGGCASRVAELRGPAAAVAAGDASEADVRVRSRRCSSR